MDTRANFRARRLALGLSREELGALAGLSHESIRTAEANLRKMGDATLGKITRALDDAEAARATPRGTGASSRAELDALRAEVHELSAQVFELLETLRHLGVSTGKQPGGLQGLQPRPSVRQPRT